MRSTQEIDQITSDDALGINKKLLKRGENNFDFIRILAALFVMIAHSYDLTGNKLFEPHIGNMNFGSIGIFIFFTISGFLIIFSWNRDPSIFRFAWKRILRLIPGLVFVTLFVMFIIGPLVTNLSLIDYFTHPNTWLYLRTTLIVFYRVSNFLPGVFQTNPFPYYTNGSLWTLPYEVYFYAAIIILGVIGILKRRILIILLIGIAFFFDLFYFFYPYETIVHILLGRNLFLGLFLYFFIGVAFFLYQEKIIYNYKYGLIALIITIIFGVLELVQIIAIFRHICFFTLPYLIFYVAFQSRVKLRNFAKYGDLSYGMYIFAFPIQQTIAFYLGGINPYLMFVVSIVIVIPLAFVSWHLVEKRAINLKKVDLKKYFFKRYKKVDISKIRISGIS